jgi:hypothetical protein
MARMPTVPKAPRTSTQAQPTRLRRIPTLPERFARDPRLDKIKTRVSTQANPALARQARLAKQAANPSGDVGGG